MATNNFLPFAPTDTGTNLLTQGEYAVATDRTIGNQPGIASAKLVNKAIRQSAFIMSQIAQFIGDKTGSNVLDDADTTKLLAQLNASILPIAPTVRNLLTGSGTYNGAYTFFIATGSATATATYTNNGVTYTVLATVASGLQIRMSGSGAPTASGTLTKSGGTGDATLTFYAVRTPVYLKVRMVGGGGGGAGSGVSGGTAAGTGGTTTFGSSLLTCTGGQGGSFSSGSGSGGTPTISSPAYGTGMDGGQGGGSSANNQSSVQSELCSGFGACSYFGGSGGTTYGTAGTAARTNSGSGGGGGGTNVISQQVSGAGGAAGAYLEAYIPNPSATYAYAVGAAGTAGGAGGGGSSVGGGLGGSGLIEVTEHWQ